MGLAGARRRGARDRDDLVAGVGVDARPPVLGRPRAGPGHRVPSRRARHRPPAPLLRLLDARPLRSLGLSSYSLYLIHGPIVIVVYEKVVAGRFGQRRSGLPRHGRPGGAADDRVRAALRGGLRDPVPAAARLVLASPAAASSTAAGAGMSRTVWTWGRLLGPGAIFAVLVWRLGTGPFLDGVRTVDGRALAAAAALGAADHGVLRLAVEDRGPRPRRRPAAARCGRGVLPVAVPQRHAARRGRGRRPPRGQPRSRRERCRPRAAGRRAGSASPGRSCRSS